LPVLVHGQISEEDERESAHGGAAALAEEAEEEDVDVARVAELIVRRTNTFRQAEGRQPVEVDPALGDAAQYFANYMARTDTYGHMADDHRPAERAAQHAYAHCIIAENIATAYSSAGFTTEQLGRHFIRGWQQSPGHRRNMLAPAVTDTGVAVARSDQTGYYYAVQMFGRPRSQRTIFHITNRADEVVEYTIGDRTFPIAPLATRIHQRCRPAAVTFHRPDTQEVITVQSPTDGEHYIIAQNNSGALIVTRQ
jgi:uncharacterized protein YkwD